MSRPLLIPIALILLGALLLATNLQWVSADTWRWLLQLWPILLVLLGVELVLTGRASWGAAFFLLIVILVVGAVGVGRTVFPPGRDSRPFGTPLLRAATLDQPLDGAREAEVNISFGAGRLSITGGAAEGYLSQGSVSGDQDDVRTSYRVRAGLASLSVRTDNRGLRFLSPDASRELEIRLANAIPLRRLELAVGASEVEATLSDLQLADLRLQAGASRVTVKLPTRGNLNAEIQGGASSIVIHVPPNVAADIRVDGGISGVEVDRTRFPSTNTTGVPGLGFQANYRSPNFDSAPDRVLLRIQSGAANVEVR
ncbi:MAG: hypothetical protein HY534_04950 [Chloroflexi bacterium]|nr:hypothetical protein [Chloroflexota bacterium]